MQRSLIKRIAAFSIGLLFAGAASAADTHPSFKVDVTGTGTPIILIPGLASPGDVWDGTVALTWKPVSCAILMLGAVHTSIQLVGYIVIRPFGAGLDLTLQSGPEIEVSRRRAAQFKALTIL